MIALDDPHVHIIAHPTGRLMGVRDAYDMDLDSIFKKAAVKNICMEISAYPERLDLNDVNAMAALKEGIKFSIGTDSHVLNQLGNLYLGVSVARRAWAEKKDVINTLSKSELLNLFHR